MDWYRILGEDARAQSHAEEVIRAGTDVDGTERFPMRSAEARVTLGVTAARGGDLEQALAYGLGSLEDGRKSLPHPLMASRELATVLDRRYPAEPAARNYSSICTS